MLCVGSVGIGWVAQRVWAIHRGDGGREGSLSGRRGPISIGGRDSRTIQRLDRRRYRRATQRTKRWSTRALDEAACGMRPCLLSARGTVSSADCHMTPSKVGWQLWRERFPDLHIRAVSTGGSLPQFLGGYRNDVRLAVVSADDADHSR